MKKFSFSLQRLLDYKEQVLDIERSVLTDMIAVLNRLLDELDGLRDERVRRSVDYMEIIAQGTTPMEMQMHRNYLERLDWNIESKKGQIELQRQAVDKQTDKVREAKLEISTYEKLREKKLEEYNYLDNKEQEIFIDEFVSNLKAVSNLQGA